MRNPINQFLKQKLIQEVMLIFGLLCLGFITPLCTQESHAELIQAEQFGLSCRMANLPMPFIANLGQTDERVRFYAKTFGGTVFITNNGEIVYSLPRFINPQSLQVAHVLGPSGLTSGSYEFPAQKEAEIDNLEPGGLALKEELVGGKVNKIEGEREAITKVSYFKGKHNPKWMSNIPTYNLLSFGEVYEGIELKLKAYGNNIEKLFVIKPGAKPRTIRVRLSGAKALKVNRKGELELETGLGTVKFTKPVAYQEKNGNRNYLEVAYAVKGDEYSFNVADYDRTEELVIDPLLASTFLGGNDNDLVTSMKVNSRGDVYVAGYTASSDFPWTADAYDPIFNGGREAFIAKFDSSLENLLSLTFLGSSGVFCISTASDSNIYVVGSTGSDFPTTPDAYDRTYNGDTDGFISKLDGNLANLLASTFLGGADHDEATSISIDASGNIFVAGYTGSSDFPVTPGAYDKTYNGDPRDVFVSKLDSNLQNLHASTFIGGAGVDVVPAISIHSNGNVYLVGGTESLDFPTTPDAYDRTYNGSRDVFVSILDSNLANLVASTFLGGSDYEYFSDDFIYQPSIDSNGNVYLVGGTESLDFPTTPGAYDRTHNGSGDAFVSILDSNLANFLASTFLGGTDFDVSTCTSLDFGGNIWVAGGTNSLDFPTTPGAYDRTHNGSGDAFVSILDSNLANLVVSTFLGGSDQDWALRIRIVTGGNIYLTGITVSSDFPSTASAYDPTFNGGSRDVFISLLDISVPGTCGYNLIPSNIDFDASGGSGSFSVDASDSSCFWTATSNNSWIHITSASSGTGNGAVNFSVDENTWLSERNGTITVEGQTFFVIQSGSMIPSETVNLPKTGQQTCYDMNGNVIDCTGTGQDGDIQAGVAWPEPRFTDNGDGTITDNLTGLMWLKNANCFGGMNWQSALDTIANFNHNPGNYNCEGYLANYTDWRLPNINELKSLENDGMAILSMWLEFTCGFLNVLEAPGTYWSSTTYAYRTSGAWTWFEDEIAEDKTSDNGVWPVRGTTTPPSLIWKTGQTTSYATGDDGDIQAGVAWPEPRFTDNGDGTITDNLTGLIWLKDGNCFGTMNWQSALDTVANFNYNPGNYNCNGYLANYTDWRLPNRKELHSLTDFSKYDLSLPQNNPFTNLQYPYWSSTTEAFYKYYAWAIGMYDGGIGGFSKSVDTWYHVLPVRGGVSVQKNTEIINYNISSGTYNPGDMVRADMTFKNNTSSQIKFKGILEVRSPTGDVYSSYQTEVTPPGGEDKFTAGDTIRITIPEDAALGWYEAKLELRDYDTDELYDETEWISNQFKIERGDPAEKWVNLLGTSSTDRGHSITADLNNNVYVTGYTKGDLDGNTNAGDTDIFIAKYNTHGTKQWTKLLGTSVDEKGYGIAVDSSGNVYVTGYTEGDLVGNTNAGDWDIFIAKYDTNGTKQWAKLLGTSGGDGGYGIVVDSSGNVYVTGHTKGDLDGNPNAGDRDIFIAKYDTNGTKQWTKLLGTSGNEKGYGIVVDSSGNVYITGYTTGDLHGNTNAGLYDIFVTKYDPSGTKQWTKLLGTSGNEKGEGIVVDSSGNVYVTGYTTGDLDGNTNAGNWDIFIAKYDTNGTKQWTKLLGTSSIDYGLGITADSSSNVYVTGYTKGDLDGNTNAGDRDIFIAKYDTNGTKQWTKLLGTLSNDYGFGITADSNSNVYVTGNTMGDLDGNPNAGLADIFVWKLKLDLENTAVKGDINGDRAVDLLDAVLALQLFCSLTPDGVNKDADVNGDGKIGLQDVIYILQKVSGLK